MRSLNPVVLSLVVAACSGTTITNNNIAETGGTAGNSNNGGVAGIGGSKNGTGGSTAVAGTYSVGGTSSSGGQGPVTGGSSTKGTGGMPGSGGQATGGVECGGLGCGTGGGQFTGGSKSIGGSSSIGGTSSSGGTSATGGMSTTGGMTSTGGNLPTGGTMATGGTASSGGTKANGGTTSSGGTSGSGCSGSLETIQASSGLCIATMATIAGPSGGSDYSIDRTEVTQGQYNAWLSTNPALPASTDVNCGYVTSYAVQAGGYTGTDADHHPIVNVDWCDAYSYCSAVGKRLCGAIGGGSNDYASFADATKSQWYRACSSGGTNAYPYGSTYQASDCDGSGYGTGTTISVGSLGTCMTTATGFAGVYDLSGNVWEWEDSCDSTGHSAHCLIRGGSFVSLDLTVYLSCGLSADYGFRDAVGDGNYNNTGFRCCSL